MIEPLDTTDVAKHRPAADIVLAYKLNELIEAHNKLEAEYKHLLGIVANLQTSLIGTNETMGSVLKGESDYRKIAFDNPPVEETA